jgi:hypothetical protein
MENQHSPSTGSGPPSPYSHIPLSSRLATCAGTLDRVCGFVDALYDTIALMADHYDENLTSRLYLATLITQELRGVSDALTGVQIAFVVREGRKKRRR